MRLIKLTDQQACWLNDVMGSGTLSGFSTLADEFNRKAVAEATAGYDPDLTTEQVSAAVVAVKAAQELVSDDQDRTTFGSPQWHRLETVDDRLNDALTALGE